MLFVICLIVVCCLLLVGCLCVCCVLSVVVRCPLFVYGCCKLFVVCCCDDCCVLCVVCSVVGSSLLALRCSLCVCLLFAVCGLFFVVVRRRRVARCLLVVVCKLLFVGWCLLFAARFVVCCLLCVADCRELLIVCCLCLVVCSLWFVVRCVLCVVYCSWYAVWRFALWFVVVFRGVVLVVVVCRCSWLFSVGCCPLLTGVVRWYWLLFVVRRCALSCGRVRVICCWLLFFGVVRRASLFVV